MREMVQIMLKGLLATFGLLGSLLAAPQLAAQSRDVGRLYAENCAGCHGRDLEGGQTSSMVDDVWKYGADDASIARVIREGAESEGMPSWKGMLSESEIRAMVVFIREKGEQARQRAAKVPKPLDDQPVRSREHTFRLRSVAENLATPWSLAFLPDGRMLVTELPGHLRFIEGGKVSAPVAGTPRVRAQG
mgnify:FL=1